MSGTITINLLGLTQLSSKDLSSTAVTMRKNSLGSVGISTIWTWTSKQSRPIPFHLILTFVYSVMIY